MQSVESMKERLTTKNMCVFCKRILALSFRFGLEVSVREHSE